MESVKTFFRYFLKYIWIPIAVVAILFLLLLAIRFGVVDALLDAVNAVADWWQTHNYPWFGWCVSLVDYMQEVNAGFAQLLVLLVLIILVVVTAIVEPILFLALNLLWGIVYIILEILAFILSLLIWVLVYLVLPVGVTAVAVYLLAIRGIRYEEEIGLRRLFGFLGLALCLVALVFFYVYAFAVPY